VTRLSRIICAVLIPIAGLVLIWQLVVEIVEPHFVLWLRPTHRPLEVDTIGSTALRLYGDARPYVGKIAGLQKGLVWVQSGKVLVEEGYGFGCPIVVVDGRAFVSRAAETEIGHLGEVTRLTKRYQVDTVDTPVQFLRRKYQPVSPIGVVTVRYDLRPQGVIDITVDFSGLERSWSKAYLMNEQGASQFTRYYDAAGTQLDAGDIGIWETKSGFVSRACFESRDGHLAFCVDPEEPAKVYYGREQYNQYNWRGIYLLSWSGVDIEISGPRSEYHYHIVLEAQ
jgi:hypothetical protein